MTPLRSRRVPAGGWSVHVRFGGTGGAPPAVLLHGLGLGGAYLRPFARCVARTRPVLVPDLPGVGRTSGRGRVLDVPELAEVLAAVLDRPSVLVGHSFTCQVAVELAARRPELVAGLVLVGPTIDARARTLRQQTGRYVHDVVLEPPRLALLLVPAYVRTGPRRLVGTVAAALRHPIEEPLARVAAPVLLVRGERDPIAPDRWLEELAAVAPRGRIAVVPGAAHCTPATHPEALAALLAP